MFKRESKAEIIDRNNLEELVDRGELEKSIKSFVIKFRKSPTRETLEQEAKRKAPRKSRYLVIGDVLTGGCGLARERYPYRAVVRAYT